VVAPAPDGAKNWTGRRRLLLAAGSAQGSESPRRGQRSSRPARTGFMPSESRVAAAAGPDISALRDGGRDGSRVPQAVAAD